MSEAAEKVVLTFQPTNEGEYLAGVPARDLTEADVARLAPAQLRDATAAGPSGEPLYATPKGVAAQTPAKIVKGSQQPPDAGE